MKFLSALYWLLLFPCLLFGKVTIGTWNLQHFGSAKDEQAIHLIAETVRGFDIVALQEVSARGGAGAVARLAEALNRGGDHWDYVVSDLTTSERLQERERYAYLWKTASVKRKGKAFLDTCFADEICREPFLATFVAGGREFTLVNFHAVPQKKRPQDELKYLWQLPDRYGMQPIFLGDFNCPESHSIFRNLKRAGFRPALSGQKTTLKQRCAGEDCLASAYDNILYPVLLFKPSGAGIIPFYRQFRDMAAARKLSDHVPVFLEID